MLALIGLAMAILFRRSFCSWICPVGFLISDAEYVQRIQENQINSYGHPGM